jgi:hypothetical protein
MSVGNNSTFFMPLPRTSSKCTPHKVAPSAGAMLNVAWNAGAGAGVGVVVGGVGVVPGVGVGGVAGDDSAAAGELVAAAGVAAALAAGLLEPLPQAPSMAQAAIAVSFEKILDMGLLHNGMIPECFIFSSTLSVRQLALLRILNIVRWPSVLCRESGSTTCRAHPVKR